MSEEIDEASYLGAWSKTLHVTKNDIINNRPVAVGKVTNGFVFELRLMFSELITDDNECALKMRNIVPSLSSIPTADIAKRVASVCAHVMPFLRKRDPAINVFLGQPFQVDSPAEVNSGLAQSSIEQETFSKDDQAKGEEDLNKEDFKTQDGHYRSFARKRISCSDYAATSKLSRNSSATSSNSSPVKISNTKSRSHQRKPQPRVSKSQKSRFKSRFEREEERSKRLACQKPGELKSDEEASVESEVTSSTEVSRVAILNEDVSTASSECAESVNESPEKSVILVKTSAEETSENDPDFDPSMTGKTPTEIRRGRGWNLFEYCSLISGKEDFM